MKGICLSNTAKRKFCSHDGRTNMSSEGESECDMAQGPGFASKKVADTILKGRSVHQAWSLAQGFVRPKTVSSYDKSVQCKFTGP